MNVASSLLTGSAANHRVWFRATIGYAIPWSRRTASQILEFGWPQFAMAISLLISPDRFVAMASEVTYG